MEIFERITKFKPSWDKRDPDPKKDYGIHCVDCMMVLKGSKGAVHFIFSTGMLLKHLREKGKDISHLFPMGVDVGYHSPVPMREGDEVNHPTKMVNKNPKQEFPTLEATQEERTEYLKNIAWEKVGDTPPNCDWLGVPCYCDGSALRADEWIDILVREGSDKIWEMLEEYYKDKFEHA